MKRTLSLIIVLAMAFSLMLGVIPSAEEAAGELDISEARVEFGDVVYLFIAVDYTASDAEGITLQITNNKTGAQTILEPDASIEVREGRVAFKYTDLGAKNIGDELTLQALKNGVASGDSVNYSVLEYAIKAQDFGDANLTNLVNAMVAYGAAAQEAYEHEGSYDLTKNYGLVVVSGSAEGKAIAEVGSTATFTPDVAGSTLYDMTLTAVDSITVPAGNSKFFYISEAQRTPVNFDATTATFATVEGGTAAAERTRSNYYTNEGNTGSNSRVTSNANSEGQVQADQYVGSFFEAVSGANGYLKLSAGTTKASIAFKEFNGDLHIRNAGARVFTLAITLGREGLTNFAEGNLSLVGVNNLGVLTAKNNGNKTEFRALVGSALERDENGDHITLCTLNAEDGVNKYVTFYIVVDIDAGTYTIYNSLNNKVHTNTGYSNKGTSSQGFVSGDIDRAALLQSYFAAGGANDNLFAFSKTNASDASALLQKCKLYIGNIFE